MPAYLDFIHIYTLILYYNSVCTAELYQVNRTRTLCYSDVAEFECYQHDTQIVWTITSISSDVSIHLEFHTLFDTARKKSTTIDSTTVRAQLIFGNGSFIMSKLIIVAYVAAIIECDTERISYRPQNSKLYY